MEEHLSKDRILELYVNAIEWGQGIFGIEAAARTYFQKSARHIPPWEAARLAAVLPKPLQVQPTKHDAFVERRATRIFRRMETMPTHMKTCTSPLPIGFIQFVNELWAQRQEYE